MATGVYFIKPKLISLYPLSGPEGTEVTADGVGFPAYNLVLVDFGTQETITTTETTGNGTFLAKFIVNNQPAGTTLITLTAYNLQLTTSFFITKEDLPDLTITKIKISPNRPIFEGDRINVVAWIKNIGSKHTENIEIAFLDQTDIKGTRSIRRLNPGQTEAREMHWRIYPFGTHTISVIADRENVIPEKDEDNNIGTKTIFVLKRQGSALLMGTITDKNTHNPLPNTLVIAIGKSFGMDRTDSNGRYIIGDLKPGRYIVTAIKRGYIPEIKKTSIHLSPLPNILDLELKKRREAELSFDELYQKILSNLSQDITLSKEEFNPEFLAFSAASFLSANSSEEPIFLEEPGTATLKIQREGESLLIKASLKNILVAKIETELEIESGDLLKERSANMLRTTNPEGITGEGVLVKLKIEPAEEPIEVHCTFVDCLGNTFSIQESIEPEAPTETQLLQSYPNPADNSCYIPFKLSTNSNVTVEIYNILGQKVRTIEAGERKAGSYTKQDRAIFWNLKNNNGQNVAKGLYFYQLKAGNFKATKAMVVK
ncbi:MAG: CARDB domain-containing protein [bacterium]|nr:CARDB domain-containing protein [bacterium]